MHFYDHWDYAVCVEEVRGHPGKLEPPSQNCTCQHSIPEPYSKQMLGVSVTTYHKI